MIVKPKKNFFALLVNATRCLLFCKIMRRLNSPEILEFNNMGSAHSTRPDAFKVKLTQAWIFLISWRKKCCGRSNWRRWNDIVQVKATVVCGSIVATRSRFQIVNLQFLLVALSTSTDVGCDGFQKFRTTAAVAGGRRFHLDNRLFSLCSQHDCYFFCLRHFFATLCLTTHNVKFKFMPIQLDIALGSLLTHVELFVFCFLFSCLSN